MIPVIPLQLTIRTPTGILKAWMHEMRRTLQKTIQEMRSCLF